MHRYGFLVSQSYSEDFGTPGTKSTISGVNFTGSKTTVTTSGKYPRVGVDCGHCTGTWDWSQLSATGGESSDIVLTGGAKVSVKADWVCVSLTNEYLQISGGSY